MRLLAVDPGVRGCGCSIWDNQILLRATYVRGSKEGDRAEAWIAMAKAVKCWAAVDAFETNLIIELPRVYPGQRQKGDQNDLIELAAVVGAVCSSVSGSIRIVYPYEWKGQVPKAIHHQRALAKLSHEEISRIEMPAKSLAHNVYDAVAMGLVALKRL